MSKKNSDGVYDWEAEDAFGDREATDSVYRSSRVVRDLYQPRVDNS